MTGGVIPHTYERGPDTTPDGSYLCRCRKPLVHRVHPHEPIETRPGRCACMMPVDWPGHYRKD